MIALPIDDFLEEALKSVQSHGNLVITAAPGAGKTTRLPAYLAKHSTGKVLVLEPRRMAAIAAAYRVGEEQNWNLGEEVGYQVRFANKTSDKTKLIFLTEALLSRKLAQDPELAGVEYVVLDEFHERSLHVDLALGLLREMQELGSAIKLVVMSATLDSPKISQYLGSAPILDVPGKLFPLEIKYQKNSQLLQTSPQFFENLVAQVKEAARETAHDILVFLPGVGEIDRASQNLETWANEKSIDLVPLHGSLPLESQRKALQKGARRKVLLSTNIAESSVTVDGVACVIDSGLAKNMKFDLRTGFSRLEMSRISRASSQQRAGRSARQFPGVCYRMWNKLDEGSMPGHDIPEILRAELSESLLFLSAQGVTDFNSFSWFEKPGPLPLKKAIENLQGLGAIDEKNHITELGRKILQWPLPPRLAKLMLTAIDMKIPSLGADVAAILQERDFMLKQSSEAYLADRFESDILLRLEVLAQFRTDRAPRNTHRMGLQTVDQASRQILSYVKAREDESGKVDISLALQKLLLTSFSDRLARRRSSGQDKARMVGGRGIKLSPETVVRESEFFLALDGVETSQGSETLVSLAAGLSKDFLFKELGSAIEKKKDLTFDREKGQFYVREGRHFRDLPLEEGGVSIAKAQDVAEHLPEVLTQEWTWVLKENESLAGWTERLAYLIRSREKITQENIREELERMDENMPFSDEQKREAFAMASSGEKDFKSVAQKDLIYFFESLLNSDVAAFLKNEVPAKLKVPSGNFLRIQYPADRDPYMEVRIQEVFGWMETPKLLGGAQALTLHLLGPNYRPMQVTSNLTSFWQNGYPEVRKELRTRYPKHSWPEDPLTAKAEAKGRSTKF
ncbi:ATP-dependent helicase HrpB [Bdellovibrio sp. HCB337]|uniref:ATP-dependent helicase HrpB n=1 Tax=Bdellovibrio sp. HCB337 TaxID=3394358 RepID=UPI0039A721D3